MANDSAVDSDIRKNFSAAGFEVFNAPDRDTFEVKKQGCVWTVMRKDGRWGTFGPPWIILRGQRYELEDHGYQHFWYRDGKRLPVRRGELDTLHRFVEEVRYVLGIKVLYHESLGTTNARSVYDRLTGRPDRNLV